MYVMRILYDAKYTLSRCFCNVCEFPSLLFNLSVLLSIQGGEFVETINTRFKKIRKSCDKNQEEWGSILGITRPGVSDIESGRRNVTEKHIRLLCAQPIDGKHVNEKWLKSGEGDMFIQLPEEDEVAAFVSELLEDNGENPLYRIIKEIMHTYSELSPKSQEVLCDASAKLLENLQKRKRD